MLWAVIIVNVRGCEKPTLLTIGMYKCRRLYWKSMLSMSIGFMKFRCNLSWLSDLEIV